MIRYVAFDVEAAGPGFNNPIIAIGAAWADVDPNVRHVRNMSPDAPLFPLEIHKRRWCCRVDRGLFQKKCYEEFWSKNLNVLEELEKTAVEPSKVWDDIYKFLELDGMKAVILSDNPAYDLTKMDYELFKYTGRLGVRYGLREREPGIITEEYRRVEDPVAQSKFHPDKELFKRILQTKNIQNNHFPEDDAERILMLKLLILNAEPI